MKYIICFCAFCFSLSFVSGCDEYKAVKRFEKNKKIQEEKTIARDKKNEYVRPKVKPIKSKTQRIHKKVTNRKKYIQDIMSIYTDRENGCQYIVFSTMITPRLDRLGEPVCYPLNDMK